MVRGWSSATSSPVAGRESGADSCVLKDDSGGPHFVEPPCSVSLVIRYLLS